jgi:thiol-disulfide isomerase/thioredoxin
MTSRSRGLVFALLGTLALAPCLAAAAKQPRRGDPVADLAFTDFSGAEHHLSDFSGKYVLLDFWATWCKPCLQETPDLKKARERFESRGLVIIGMNSDKKKENAERFVRENEIPWLQSSAESTNQVLHHVLKVKWYPTLILVGPDGKILAVSEGEKPPLYGPALLETLEKTLPAGRS